MDSFAGFGKWGVAAVDVVFDVDLVVNFDGDLNVNMVETPCAIAQCGNWKRLAPVDAAGVHGHVHVHVKVQVNVNVNVNDQVHVNAADGRGLSGRKCHSRAAAWKQDRA